MRLTLIVLSLIFAIPAFGENDNLKYLNQLIDQSERYDGDSTRLGLLQNFEREKPDLEFLPAYLILLINQNDENPRVRAQAAKVLVAYSNPIIIPHLKRMLQEKPIEDLIPGNYKDIELERTRLYIEFATALGALDETSFPLTLQLLFADRERLFGWDSGQLYTELYATLFKSKLPTDRKLKLVTSEFVALTTLIANYKSSGRFIYSIQYARAFIVENASKMLTGPQAVYFLKEASQFPMDPSDKFIKDAFFTAYKEAATSCARLLDAKQPPRQENKEQHSMRLGEN